MNHPNRPSNYAAIASAKCCAAIRFWSLTFRNTTVVRPDTKLGPEFDDRDVSKQPGSDFAIISPPG
jgi:hypothetical protein